MNTQHEGDRALLERENERRRAHFDKYGGMINGICFDCLGPLLAGTPHDCPGGNGLTDVRRRHAEVMKGLGR